MLGGGGGAFLAAAAAAALALAVEAAEGLRFVGVREAVEVDFRFAAGLLVPDGEPAGWLPAPRLAPEAAPSFDGVDLFLLAGAGFAGKLALATKS